MYTIDVLFSEVKAGTQFVFRGDSFRKITHTGNARAGLAVKLNGICAGAEWAFRNTDVVQVKEQ